MVRSRTLTPRRDHLGGLSIHALSVFRGVLIVETGNTEPVVPAVGSLLADALRASHLPTSIPLGEYLVPTAYHPTTSPAVPEATLWKALNSGSQGWRFGRQ